MKITKKISIKKEEDFSRILSWLNAHHSARDFHYYLNRKPINRNRFFHLFEKANLYDKSSIELKLSENSNIVFEVNASFIDRNKDYLRIKHLYTIKAEDSKKELSSYI